MSTKLSIALGTCESDQETWQYNWQLLKNQVRKSHRQEYALKEKKQLEKGRASDRLCSLQIQPGVFSKFSNTWNEKGSRSDKS